MDHHLPAPSHELTSLSCWLVTQMTGLWGASEGVECPLKQTNVCVLRRLYLKITVCINHRFVYLHVCDLVVESKTLDPRVLDIERK